MKFLGFFMGLLYVLLVYAILLPIFMSASESISVSEISEYKTHCFLLINSMNAIIGIILLLASGILKFKPKIPESNLSIFLKLFSLTVLLITTTLLFLTPAVTKYL